MRDATINLRALPEQRYLVDHAGSQLGKDRSVFMLERPTGELRPWCLMLRMGSIKAWSR